MEKTQENTSLLGPLLDPLMMGGLACIFFIGHQIFVSPTESSTKLSWIMYYASFVINFPHFMASYQLLYSDYKNEILKKKTYIWAAIVCPILLITILFILIQKSIASNDPSILGWAATFMFFSVGHHYVKQTYGCIMVMSAAKKCFYDNLEARVLWLNMYSVWMMSFLSINRYASTSNKFYGIPYRTFAIDNIFSTINYYIVAITGIIFLALQVKKYIEKGSVMPFSASMALIAIYVWYIPANHHPHYFLMIPFFHSLQYLLFSTTLAKNKAKDISSQLKDEKEQRKEFLKRITFFLGMTLLTGFLAWDFIPKTMDKYIETHPLLGVTLFMFCFQIFLNVHHYFIDNVIWRRDNEQMKKYLRPLN